MRWRRLAGLLAGFTQSLDVDSVTRIQDRIGQALEHMNVVGSEAEHERSARLAVGPNTEPLLRTLLRLRHASCDDRESGHRSTARGLPDAARVAAGACRRRVRGLPTRQRSRVAPCVGVCRPSMPWKWRSMPTPARSPRSAQTASRELFPATRQIVSFALGFAIEQLHLDFKDLEQCVAEWAGSSRQAGRNKSV